MDNDKKNGVRRRLNFNAVANKVERERARERKPRKKAPKKADYIRQYIHGIAQLRNPNINPQNEVNKKRIRIRKSFTNTGYNGVLTNQSQKNLADSLLTLLSMKKQKDLSTQSLTNIELKGLRNKLDKDKKIKKDTDVKLEDILWLTHHYLQSQRKLLTNRKKQAVINERKARNKEYANLNAKKKAEEKQKKAAAKVIRNKAEQNRLALLNNNVRKALNNGEVKIKQLKKDISAIKRKTTKGYKNINGLNPKLSAFFRKERNEGLTNKEQQDWDKLRGHKDDIVNMLGKQARDEQAKEEELEKLRNQKAKILKNAKNAEAKIKAANKAREAAAKKKAKENAAAAAKKAKENAEAVAKKAKENAAAVAEKAKKNAADKKFLGNLDAKAIANMKKQTNADIGVKKLDDEIKAIKLDSTTVGDAIHNKSHEIAKLQRKLTQTYGRQYYTVLGESNKEEDKLVLDTLKDLNKELDKMRKDKQTINQRITKAKDDRTKLKKKGKINPTKMFYLYQIGELLDNEGLYSPKIMLKLNNYTKDTLKSYYLQLKPLVELKYLKIPEFKNRAKNLMNKNSFYSALQLSSHSFTKTNENRERIFTSNVLSEKAKYHALKDTFYNLSRKGDVQKIMELKISPYWKARILVKSVFYTPFVSLDDIKLITPNVLNSNQRIKNAVDDARKRLVLKERIQIMEPIFAKKKVIKNKIKMNKGKITTINKNKIAKVLNHLNVVLTKKQKNVAKLRKNYENVNNSPNKLKLKLIKTEISRRNKEIRDIFKDMKKYKKMTDTATKLTAVVKGRLTRKVTTLQKDINKAEKQAKKAEQKIQNLTNLRAGIIKPANIANRKRLAEQKKVINRFIGKLAQNTRTTTKHKYRILNKLMEPNAAVDFAGETGLSTELARVLGKKGLVCHLEDKSVQYVKNYIPQLRESLYALSVQYLNQYNAKNTLEEKKKFHEQFLNKVVNKAAYPCLEGTFTGITNAIANEGFEWNGHKGWKKNHPYMLNKQNDIVKLRDILFAKAIGSYYKTLNNNGKKKFQGKSRKDQMIQIWGTLKEKELAHGEFITQLIQINNPQGKKVRQAYVDAFKTTAEYLYENNKIYTNEELNKMNEEFNKLTIKNLEPVIIPL